uniref:HTH CENPB-type domain-containing protein n=1 Tax=Rhabditophanes sp. KR3021 TaxID=114890 RepID=A0AC35U9S8_9BILA
MDSTDTPIHFMPQLSEMIGVLSNNFVWPNNAFSIENLAAQFKMIQESNGLVKPMSLFPTYFNLLNINIPQDAPLDLSRTGNNSLPSDLSVIRQNPLLKIDTDKESTFLPTCSNPSDGQLIKIKLESGDKKESLSLSNMTRSGNSSTISSTTSNRMSYPREFKLMVIEYFYENGQNKYRTCKLFQITKSMLNGWLSKIDKIKESRPGSLKSGRSGRKPQFPDIERQIFTLYTTQVETGRKVSNKWIRETARKLAKEQCSQEQLAGMCQFSERWLSNFKKRYGVNLNKDYGGLTEGSAVGDTSDTESFESEEIEPPIKVEEMKWNEDGSVDQILNNKFTKLPIHAFYEKYPYLCKKNSVQHLIKKSL